MKVSKSEMDKIFELHSLFSDKDVREYMEFISDLEASGVAHTREAQEEIKKMHNEIARKLLLRCAEEELGTPDLEDWVLEYLSEEGISFDICRRAFSLAVMSREIKNKIPDGMLSIYNGEIYLVRVIEYSPTPGVVNFALSQGTDEYGEYVEEIGGSYHEKFIYRYYPKKI